MHDRHVFIKAHETWSAGDLDGLLSCLHDDIVYTINVDGIDYAAGSNGKANVRNRLLIKLDTFEVQAFLPEWIVHNAEYSRSSVLGFYKHKKTGTRLEVRARFTVYIRDGLIVRMEEVHDAAYLEAFHRFVTFLESAAEAS